MHGKQIDCDRRRLLGNATMGIAIAGAASLLPGELHASVEANAIRPFRVNVAAEEDTSPRGNSPSFSALSFEPRSGHSANRGRYRLNERH